MPTSPVAVRPARRPLAWLLAALIAIAMLTAGAGPTTAPAAAAKTRATKTVTINIRDFAYSKATVRIKLGQRVRWVNRDEMKHNARSTKSGGPRGPLLAKGKSYTWTPKKTGTFSYSCTPHPWMKGKVIVTKR